MCETLPAATRSAANCQAHRRGPRFWWSVRRASARWHEREPPFCAARLLVNLNDGAVDERIFKVELVTHRVEKTFKYACLGPAAETSELAVPLPETRRQVAPRRACPNAPEDRFQKQTVILRRGPRVAGLARQMRFKPLSKGICHNEPLIVHSNLHFGSLNHKSANMGILIVHGP